ncbi:MAG: SDR family oxidoreductase [Mollicutes bacterium]|jgi:short-subunit dehydrogenase|nr:SDR family oxidoreductase [Mollicutes bacterium]
MKALITGASSGIGKDFAIALGNMGYDLILVARNQENLEKVKKEIKTNVQIIPLDVSTTTNCIELYNKIKEENIDILINNAGVGVFGEFSETDLNKELSLIDLNIKAVHTLTKLFLKDFKKRNSGYILNVGSTAAFSPGPLMATYFASKAYVLRLTQAIYEELRQEKSNVYIGVLCPGPVNTNFNNNLGIKFKKAQESKDVVEYAIKKMFKRKLVIIPSLSLRLNTFFNRFIPTKVLLKANYNVQIKKKITKN